MPRDVNLFKLYTDNIRSKKSKPVRVGDKEYVSLAQASYHLNLSIGCVRNMAKNGKLTKDGLKVEFIPKEKSKIKNVVS